MPRVWFNRSFSSVHSTFELLRGADTENKLSIICSHSHLDALQLLFSDERYIEPSNLTDDEYLSWCLDFCREHQIDVFVPGKKALFFAANSLSFENTGTRVLCVAKAENLDLIDDKAKFYNDLPTDIAIPPDFKVAVDANSFNEAYRTLRDKHEQICVKPARSVFGLGFRILDEARGSVTHLIQGIEYQIPLTELEYSISKVASFAPMLVMEYLDGPEWSVDCVADQGRLVTAIQRKKPKSSGHPQVIDNVSGIHTSVERLIKRYFLNGLINVQFRAGRDGIRILEINARASGGLAMACLAGPNLPYIAINGFIHGFENMAIPAIRYGIKVGEARVPVEFPA